MDYWDDRKFELAQRELLLANERLRLQTKNPDGSLQVLGATTYPLDLLTEWREEPVRLESTYQFWKRTSEEKPDYRDAQLMAGLLAWQLGQTKEAKEYVTRFENLDGGSEKFKDMLRILSGKK